MNNPDPMINIMPNQAVRSGQSSKITAPQKIAIGMAIYSNGATNAA
jgi:hypothetical protein